ncbi:RHS repeat-associated core domain-containing protein [Luteimonas salinilitoris]|uniref:RHS repeat-associated core domain-containing protein n=1 Tax=Luteimonas salinilitoris TaxID=3237697 RepID=A0ABV4HLE5_9GAMM
MNALTKRWGLWLLLGLAWMQPAQAQTVVRYYHTDALGSVVERREYEPYGAQLTPAVQDGPGYTGHVQDAATGLVYMQQRYYDAKLGRFLSVDPVTADANTGGNFNRYWYANNNPYKSIDPDGRRACGKDTTCRLEQGERGGTIRVNAGGSTANASIPEAPSPNARPTSAATKSFAQKAAGFGEDVIDEAWNRWLPAFLAAEVR